MKSEDPLDEGAWVERIRRGDEDAFDEMVRMYYTALFDFARSHTRSAFTAEDVVQDVLLAVWRRRADWEPTGTVRSYLFRAVRNRSLNYLRDHALHRGPSVDDEGPWQVAGGPDEELRYRELLRRYRSAVAEMPERRRLVFRLSRLYGLTYGEIAEVMDISINTVRTQMTAALAHLREHLSDYL